ncbi:MAG: glutamyl-tRNA reductase [Deltaproteobacteria bacterium]|nr:glutamyl-tRNA reductase [Deltaproteobacteria bacterium]
MEIILIGLSHKTAPVEIRERFCLTRDGVVESLDRMRGISGIREGVVLSTCNRLEILAVTQEGGESEEAGLRALLAEMGQMGTEELAPHLYVHKSEGAIEHLFRVASSLDSMVLGEPQILGQLKGAYGQAAGCKFTGLILNKLLHRSFFVAKRVRTETRIANQAVSVSFAAVELAKKILGELEDKRVLIVGAGEMSELAAQHLISQGVKEILVTNRTFSRAAELAKEFNGKAIPFEEFHRQLPNMDIILSSTGSSQYIIRREELTSVIRMRKNRPMFFIDIAVPRDIDPKINEMDNVYVYDIDDLEGIVEVNKGERKKEVTKAQGIIAEGVKSFNQWQRGLEVVPTILALREQAEDVRRRELTKTLSLMKNSSEEDRRLLEVLTTSVVNKILHGPISMLKHQEERGHGKLYTDMIRKIFRLDPEDEEEPLSHE